MVLDVNAATLCSVRVLKQHTADKACADFNHNIEVMTKVGVPMGTPTFGRKVLMPMWSVCEWCKVINIPSVCFYFRSLSPSLLGNRFCKKAAFPNIPNVSK